MDIKVSICCLVYNHEPYLRKTLEGFVSQKTNFDFEVLIHDDASTDESANIIREYCEKYPSIFRPVYQAENQHSKKVPISKTFLYPMVRGKYVALCEGDDYWCDSSKLQLQYDYMETHPQCSMCTHDTAYIDFNGDYLGHCVNGSRANHNYSASAVIKADGAGLFQTSSFFAKRHIIVDLPTTYYITGIGDLPIAIYAGVSGYVHYIGRVMSCYRTGHAGSWSVLNEQKLDAFLKRRQFEYDRFTCMDKETGRKYALAFAAPRGLRLSSMYRKQYGILKLLTKPSHLILVFWAHCHSISRKIRKKLLTIKNRGEQIHL